MVDLNIELPKGFLEEEVRCGYTVTRKMKEVWAVELDLLKETLDSDDFFCFKPWIDESGKRHFNLKKVLRHFKHKLLKDSYVPIYNQFINEITKYAEYKKLAGAEEKVIFGGRLGEYKYYDMDAVIASALDMCEKELQ